MDTLHLVLLWVAITEFVILIAIGIYSLVKKNSKKIVKEKRGVRYTVKDAAHATDGSQNATFVENDIMLQADEVYKVNKEGPVKPGRYNILSTMEGKQKVTIMINGVRRNHAHNSGVVFAEGDLVIAQHEPLILR